MCAERLFASVLCLLAVACGPLPRPFAPEPSDPPNQLLMLPDRVGVTVGRVPGLDPKAAGALAEALAESLRRADVVASTRGGNSASFDIDGHIDRDGDSRRLVLELVRPGGVVAASHTIDIPGALAEIARDGERDWRPIADAAAPKFASVLLGEPSPQAPAMPAPVAAAPVALAPVAAAPVARPPAVRPPLALAQPAAQTPAKLAATPAATIAILAVTGAAGDNGRVLARALEFNLQQYNIQTAAKTGANVHQVRGEVKITAKAGNQRNLAVVWTVLGPDGKEIGKVEQANDVPAQMLQTAWSDIAFAVAEGAAEGIVNVLEEHGILP